MIENLDELINSVETKKGHNHLDVYFAKTTFYFDLILFDGQLDKNNASIRLCKQLTMSLKISRT